MKPFRRMAVLGLGLLGGSVARGAKVRGLAESVIGCGRREQALQRACNEGVIDATASPTEAVQGADLVVVATPVFAMESELRRVAAKLAPGTIVTDVGSVKGVLSETLPALLPAGVHYVGSHPMAGSHRRGVEYANPDLFEGAPCVVTATPETDVDAKSRLVAFWSALGAEVVERSPAQHDAEVAWVSHVPHVLAFAFARALASAPTESRALRGSGFRDFTRIAQSDAELWSDILGANRKAIAGPLHEVSERLGELARALESNDGDAVERFIAASRESLAALRSDRESESPAPSGDSNRRTKHQI